MLSKVCPLTFVYAVLSVLCVALCVFVGRLPVVWELGRFSLGLRLPLIWIFLPMPVWLSLLGGLAWLLYLTSHRLHVSFIS